MRPGDRGRVGKSLVELLIVLAIIGLMLCLMLPAVLQAFKAVEALGT